MENFNLKKNVEVDFIIENADLFLIAMWYISVLVNILLYILTLT